MDRYRGSRSLKPGDVGLAVGDLQARLRAAGFDAPQTSVYDEATSAAVRALQRAWGLVEDGLYGPKSAAALQRQNVAKLLREADLHAAAQRLGVPLAAVKAVNAVESAGCGFLPDGRAKILFERHVFYQRLGSHGIDRDHWAAHQPAVVNPRRGGYAGGAAEYTRLALASQICRAAALESCSWGAFQIMGNHWARLGYADIEAFARAQQASEAEQLEAFVRFILTDAALLKALRGKKWAQFARAYNGPAYAENLYDVKLARAYERFNLKTAVDRLFS